MKLLKSSKFYIQKYMLLVKQSKRFTWEINYQNKAHYPPPPPVGDTIYYFVFIELLLAYFNNAKRSVVHQCSPSQVAPNPSYRLFKYDSSGACHWFTTKRQMVFYFCSCCMILRNLNYSLVMIVAIICPDSDQRYGYMLDAPKKN